MGPAAELAHLGAFGTACLHELRRLIRLEVPSFPALQPDGGWNADAYDELAQEFFRRRGKKITTALLEKAATDAIFSKYLRVSVHRFLVDLARDSDTGYIRHRLEKLLPQRNEFTAVRLGASAQPRWTVAGGPVQPHSGDLKPLLQVAFAVPAAVVRWDSETRRPPITDTPSLIAILTAVLQAAEGSLEYGELVWILARRFNAVLAAPLSLDAEDGLAGQAAAQLAGADAPGELARADRIEERAAAVRQQLTAEEISVLGLLNDQAALQAALGKGRSQTYLIRTRLIGLLREMIGGEPDRDAIMATLLDGGGP